MHFFLALGDGDRFAAGGRDQVNLADFALVVFVVIAGVFFRSSLPLGAKGDPAAIGRALWSGIVTRLRELDQRPCLAIVAVQPQVVAENLLIPIGALGSNYDRVSIGRNSNAGIADGIEEFVKREFGLAVGKAVRRETKECGQPQKMFGYFHRPLEGIRVIQRRVRQKQLGWWRVKFLNTEGTEVRRERRRDRVMWQQFSLRGLCVS